MQGEVAWDVCIDDRCGSILQMGTLKCRAALSSKPKQLGVRIYIAGHHLGPLRCLSCTLTAGMWLFTGCSVLNE